MPIPPDIQHSRLNKRDGRAVKADEATAGGNVGHCGGGLLLAEGLNGRHFLYSWRGEGEGRGSKHDSFGMVGRVETVEITIQSSCVERSVERDNDKSNHAMSKETQASANHSLRSSAVLTSLLLKT